MSRKTQRYSKSSKPKLSGFLKINFRSADYLFLKALYPKKGLFRWLNWNLKFIKSVK